MSEQIVECIANYSEARRPEVVEELVRAIMSVDGVLLLDRHSDADHNRSVLTFAGPPDQVAEAAYRSIKRAAELISLDEHTGEHPRIGATDVVPFVPITGVSMEDCVALARRLGQRVGTELNIPVYLYERAAQIPERENLENIRRGEYEKLKVEISSDPRRKPDYGPDHLGTAGATVIGARQPLIAFNIFLSTSDLSVAKKIASAVRHSSGGLRYVKALGMLVDGKAQVSMNLTNYSATPLARVVNLIRSEAQRYGVGIHHSEMVGLIPQAALVDAAVWNLQLDEFSPEQILENRLKQALDQQGTDKGPEIYLRALAASTAAPGGGSASAYCGAMSAALVSMVARLTVGRKKYQAVESTMLDIIQEADELRDQLARSASLDSEAYQKVMEAYKLPKETQVEVEARDEAIEQATLGATEVPMQVATLAVQILELAETVIRLGNINARSDGGAAAALGWAAWAGARLNVRTNTAMLRSQDRAQGYLASLSQLEKRAARIMASVSELLVDFEGLAI
jgi:glutamate formiminotransferase / formiminotetrahydrofolate cyclodeaminase